MLTATLEGITLAIVQGQPQAELQKSVDALLTGNLEADDLVTVFKVLPRELTTKHVAKFLAAEGQLGGTEVSSLLVSSNFAGCGDVTSAAVVKIVSTAVNRVPADPTNSIAQDAYRWHVEVCKHGAGVKDVDVDSHARAALVYALNAPTFLSFEPLHDIVGASTFKTTTKETALLIEFVGAVLLDGKGAAGCLAFEGKAGKGFFEGVGVQGAMRKARLLSLCKLFDGKQTVPIAEVGKALQIDSDDEVEAYVIDASLANVVDVKLDRSKGVVEVGSVVPLRFDKQAFQQLKGHIEKYIAVIDGLKEQYGLE